MSEKLSEKSEMSELEWGAHILRTEIAPAKDGKTIGSRIRDASILLRWKVSRVKDVWYSDDRVSIKPKELRQLERLSGCEYGKREIKEVDELIARADTLLANGSQDINSAVVAALKQVVGLLDSTRT